MKQLLGIHHVTAITSDIKKNYEFFTEVLGMRLIKKSINQDDIQTYHTFYGDDRGTPGSGLTFFDFKGISQVVHGRDEISRIGLRVPTDEALEYFIKRFDKYGVKHGEVFDLFNSKTLYFNDFDGQQYALISDEKDLLWQSYGIPWKNGPVPNEYAIRGLGTIFLVVSDYALMDAILTNVMQFKSIEKKGALGLYEMNNGGNGARVIVEENKVYPQAYQGYGGVHHVAFRLENKKELFKWEDFFRSKRIANSGYVDRFYFESVYVRMYRNILFELATDEPGFIDDQESYEKLGTDLALPPKFREHKKQIEKLIKPFDTSDSNRVRQKDYL
ncbi:MAG: VOC family protein [Acholeplasmataceae bacterium]|nr:VOC family protein [Acholeplasmataceae bacterium]MDD4824421.1 VOC family protein [Acholeplasmataceae bacterium]